MDILYTADEKYLQALEELRYGELSKALHYFNAIVDSDPANARAHFQLGWLYFYKFKNYQTAGYYFKQCLELEPAFPDTYVHYIKLLITLNMHNTISQTAEKALLVPGVCEACIYEQLGNYEEKRRNLDAAKQYYKDAAQAATDNDEHDNLRDDIKRVAKKLKAKKKTTVTHQE